MRDKMGEDMTTPYALKTSRYGNRIIAQDDKVAATMEFRGEVETIMERYSTLQ